MGSKPISLQPAYVLHQRPWGDTSVILELFTPEHGRMGALAKGAKRMRSPWHGLLQPFHPLLVDWRGRGELKTLIRAEPQGQALALPAAVLASGFYLNELLLRLLSRDDAQIALFGCYDAALRDLVTSRGVALETTLRRFERDLLAVLGYGLVLDHEVTKGQSLAVERRYHYVIERGPVPAEADVAGEGIPLQGGTLLALRDGELGEATQRREAKRLMRAVLAHYLGPRPLASRALLAGPAALGVKDKTNLV